MSSITIDPQEESSVTARREEAVGRRSEELQSTNAAKDRKTVCFKTRPTTEISRHHQVCYSSQYTRPVTELLAEVLEERYPMQGPVDGDADEQPLLSDERCLRKCRWLRTLARYLQWI